MNWLLSMALAGALFSAAGELPAGNFSDNPVNIKKQTFSASPETEKFEQIYSINPNGNIDVSNINGSIIVEAWDNPQIKLEYEKIAPSREKLDDLKVIIESKADSFSASVETARMKGANYGSWNKNGDKLEVRFRLTVPRTAVLNQINAVNGSIEISDMTNSTTASAVNGTITGRNLRGTVKLSTVNGTVEADLSRLGNGNNISLETVNGKVNLLLPSDVNATIKADTVNGSIENNLGLPIRKGKYVGKDLYGRIGAGNAKIKLNSVNGTLSVTRKNDGGNPNPAVNLLEQKNDKDDFDGNFDESRIQKEIEEGLANSRQEMNRAIREAQKEIEKARPELEKLSIEESQRTIENIDAAALQRELAEANRVLGESDAAKLFADSPTVEKKADSFAVRGIPNVGIETSNCKIFVRGWDKPEIRYQLTKLSNRFNRELVDFDVRRQSDSQISIKAFNSDSRTSKNLPVGKMLVQLEIFVPRKSNLKIKTDDELRIENVSGDIDLQGADEAINVRDAGGKMRIRAADGLVRVIGFTGDFQARNADGMMLLEGDFDNFRAATEDGTIVLTLPENADASIFADTTSIFGEVVNLVGEKNVRRIGNGAGKRYNFTAEDGRIYIRSVAQIK